MYSLTIEYTPPFVHLRHTKMPKTPKKKPTAQANERAAKAAKKTRDTTPTTPPRSVAVVPAAATITPPKQSTGSRFALVASHGFTKFTRRDDD